MLPNGRHWFWLGVADFGGQPDGEGGPLAHRTRALNVAARSCKLCADETSLCDPLGKEGAGEAIRETGEARPSGVPTPGCTRQPGDGIVACDGSSPAAATRQSGSAPQCPA